MNRSPSASPFREESEERVVHRLEAFSDIVIGFSLAQMTLNLVLPNDPLELFTKHSVALIAFGLTFMIVASMWWAHHRLFTHYFVPTPINIVLNFLSLGGVMFLVYALQIWIHAVQHRNVGYAVYEWSIAWVMAVLAVLTYSGVALRADRMDERLARLGYHHALRSAAIAVVFLFLGVASITLASDNAIDIALVAGLVLLMLWRLAERRFFKKNA
jgi:uncharacterized membrane protein